MRGVAPKFHKPELVVRSRGRRQRRLTANCRKRRGDSGQQLAENTWQKREAESAERSKSTERRRGMAQREAGGARPRHGNAVERSATAEPRPNPWPRLFGGRSSARLVGICRERAAAARGVAAARGAAADHGRAATHVADTHGMAGAHGAAGARWVTAELVRLGSCVCVCGG